MNDIMTMDEVNKEITERYNNMLKRCNMEIPEDEDDEENTEPTIGLGDIDAYGPKPEMKERTCERIGEGIGFERIRRITGYLVGDVSRWNNGKKSDLMDRVKHG